MNLLPPLRHSLQKALNLLVVLTGFLLVLGSQQINWVTCPTDQSEGSTYLKECAYLSYPLNREDPSLGNVTAFLRRSYYYSTPTEDSCWLVAGGPGDSTHPFVIQADYMLMMDPSLTIYTLDQRGTGLSSLMTCDNQPSGYFNPYNESMLRLYDECIQQIIHKYGNVTQYYSTYHGAMDLKETIDAVSPATVRIYALSAGTFHFNTYLQLDGARADVVVFDGPVPPNRWSLENNAAWASQVAEDIADVCVTQSSICKEHIGDEAHLPMLVRDAVVDGTLPCLSKLSWLNATHAQHVLANYNNYLASGSGKRILLGPFWYRLYRCSESDVDQLNVFNAVRQSNAYSYQSPLDYSLGLAINIGTNELYSYAGSTALTYTDQLLLTSRVFNDASPQLVTSYAKYVHNFPQYNYSESKYYLQFAKPTVPVLVVVGTLDANTENGLGPWFRNGLGKHAQLVVVPYASHGTFAYGQDCINGIIMNFLSSLGQDKINRTCLPHIPAPNFDGSTQDSQDFAYDNFGTYDLWNNGKKFDNTSSSSTCSTPSSDNDCTWSDRKVTALVCGTVIPLSAIIVVLLGYIISIKFNFWTSKDNLLDKNMPRSGDNAAIEVTRPTV